MNNDLTLLPGGQTPAPLTLNLAGAEYDFGSVIYLVLGECEHRRRSYTPDELEGELMSAARAKLGELRPGFVAAGGPEGYWSLLEREVMGTVMPQYLRRTARQNRLEESGYEVWREGDVVARVVFALCALTIGGLVIAAPFIPIWEDAFAFVLAILAWFYPELKKAREDGRHAELLNRLIAEGQQYQRMHERLLTDAAIDQALGTLPARRR